mmetsp:Transcript_16606/g.27997  ORF Transcript_16606/g.27997 Transcript_16606/m.27997 type:complete len:242 (-) Transcript_16606:365-1090(-)|eukprot:CAMPEP_0198209882 /NCGR_PEP_ID=MMETSP1445-20131203/17791_1 /TAXON_ID=36898 /ORGANISM="Pyramimonas sp., Strain CCMP2087" /LENGTH=241 /DNA_ID=CAMNT_0043883789 /DNA_START=74 /DNA_END=799 /DNA_ORIENTATION=+
MASAIVCKAMPTISAEMSGRALAKEKSCAARKCTEKMVRLSYPSRMASPSLRPASARRMFACRAAEEAAEESSIAPKYQGRKKAPKGPKEMEMFQLTAAASIANASVTDKYDALIDLAKQEWGLYGVKFEEIMDLMKECYIFEPTAYTSGKGQPYEVVNPAGTNSGSCKVFALGKLHNLTEDQTLKMFCEHYQGVLEDPNGTAHANIRSFMKNGWEGIEFATPNAMTPRTTLNAEGDTDGI